MIASDTLGSSDVPITKVHVAPMTISRQPHRGSGLRVLMLMAALWVATVGELAHASSETWPNRPIRAISPITAGSAADVVTRVVLEQVASRLGQPIVIENRAGGDGTIGSAAVARAAPDGYTILSHSTAQAVVAATRTDLTYDTYRSFARVTPVAKIPSVLVVSSLKNIRTVDQLIATARTRQVNFASPGPFNRLNTERFLRNAGLEAQRIPFKGAPEALADLVAGRVDFYFSPLSATLPQIHAGQVVALAVTGSQRSSLLPSVPTFAEVGFAKADDNFWIGLFVPAQTPRAIISHLHQQTVRSVEAPAVKEKLARIGAEPMTSSPEQFDSMLMEQILDYAALIKAMGPNQN